MGRLRKRKYAPGAPFKSTLEAVTHALTGQWFWLGEAPPRGHPLHWAVVMNWSIRLVQGMAVSGRILRAERVKDGNND